MSTLINRIQFLLTRCKFAPTFFLLMAKKKQIQFWNGKCKGIQLARRFSQVKIKGYGW